MRNLALLPPSTPATIGVYQGVIVGFLLPFGFVDAETATAYGILMFGVQLVTWIILGIGGLIRTKLR